VRFEHPFYDSEGSVEKRRVQKRALQDMKIFLAGMTNAATQTWLLGSPDARRVVVDVFDLAQL
jgi:hypothetical protein